MAELQRSSQTFRRSGSSGLVWDKNQRDHGVALLMLFYLLWIRLHPRSHGACSVGFSGRKIPHSHPNPSPEGTRVLMWNKLSACVRVGWSYSCTIIGVFLLCDLGVVWTGLVPCCSILSVYMDFHTYGLADCSIKYMILTCGCSVNGELEIHLYMNMICARCFCSLLCFISRYCTAVYWSWSMSMALWPKN